MSAVKYDLEKRIKGRSMLKDVLPLKMPYSCNVFAANVCNFKCYYCINADSNKKMQFGISNTMLSYKDFVSIVDNFSGIYQLKSMLFTGVGEPLLNKEITQMFRYAKEKQIAEKLEVITNGSCFTEELCEDIMDSRLDRIRISLNGLSEEDYKANCCVDLDYKAFKNNLKYLYEYRNKHNKNLQIYIKIMDVMVEDACKKKQFYDEYENLCDDIFIESIMPVNNISYDDSPDKFSKTLFGENVRDNPCSICPQPFYSFSIGTKGEVYPCCQIPTPESIGNLLEKNLSEIWNGREYIDFLISVLNGEFKKLPVCDKCKKYEYMTLETDILDGYAEPLIEKYKKML